MDQLTDIWVYINKHGKLIEEPACIPKKSSKWSFAIPACDRDKYTFIQEVAREPGMIFKNSVWFKKQNREKAKQIFVAYYGEQISRLTEELNTYQNEMTMMDNQEEE